MQTKRFSFLWVWVLLLFFAGSFQLWAQTNAPTAVVPFGGSTPDTAGYWDLVIAAFAPVVVQSIKWLAPKIPKWILPLSTPIIGVILGAALNYFNVHHFTWYDAAKAGAIAVAIRETWNQTITKYFTPPGSTGGDLPTTPGD